MNFVSFINRWAPCGALLGLSVGAAVHYVRTRSLFHRNSDDCNTRFYNAWLPMAINDLRENDAQRFRDSPATTIGLVNPLQPIPYVVPVVLLLTLDTIRKLRTLEGRLVPLLRQQSFQVGKHILFPIAQSWILIRSSAKIREQLKGTAERAQIDISGHAFVELAVSLHMMSPNQFMFSVASPCTAKIYAALVSVVAVSDTLWAYTTAANGHSAADVICAAAIFGSVYLTFLAVGQIANKGFGLIRSFA